MKYKRFVSALYVLNIVIQAIFTLLTPPSLLFLISWLFVSKAGAPEWIYAIAIILGILMGLVSMVKFVISASEALERLEMGRKNKRSDNTNEEK